MKFSKAYKDAQARYMALVTKNRQDIAAAKAAIPEAETKKQTAIEAQKAAAAAGDADAYTKAKTEEAFYNDRLLYLNERLTALQKKPITDQKEINSLLDAMNKEEARLQSDFEKAFCKALLSTVESCEDLVLSYRLISTAKTRIKRNIERAESSFLAPMPPLLESFDEWAYRAVTNGELKGDFVPGQQVTVTQDAERNKEQAAWDI